MIASRSAVYSAIWFALTLLSTAGLFLFQGAAFLVVATVVVYAGAIVVTFLFVIMLAQPDGHAAYDRISWGWFAKPAAAVAGALVVGAVMAGLSGFAAGDLRSQVALAADRLAAADADFPLTGDQVVSATPQQSLGGTTIALVLRGTAGELALETKTALAEELAEVLDAAQSAEGAKPLATPITLHFAEALLPHQDLQAERHMAHLGGYLFSRHLIAVEVAATLLLVALVGAIAMLSQGPGSISRAGREGDAHV
jgi:NADH-quinone oxidoreductase subunit J